jgi:acetyl esterase/lipase
MNRRIILFVLFFMNLQMAFAQKDSVYLWADMVPGETKSKSANVITIIEDGTPRVTEVTNPFFAVFEPAKDKKNGKAIIVCPGGGYVRLAAEKEGYAIARWLNNLGYTAFVLEYRVPDKRDGALQDVQRCMKMVRHNAKKYGIDPNKIGAIGFSAGAHVVARLEMADSMQRYPRQDNADTESDKPNAMIIIYPGYLSGGPNRTLTPELKAKETTAATFIFQTMDDGSAPSSLALARALQEAKANVELHMLPKGGHGYGMYPGNKAAETWPGLLEIWLKEHL